MLFFLIYLADSHAVKWRFCLQEIKRLRGVIDRMNASHLLDSLENWIKRNDFCEYKISEAWMVSCKENLAKDVKCYFYYLKFKNIVTSRWFPLLFMLINPPQLSRPKYFSVYVYCPLQEKFRISWELVKTVRTAFDSKLPTLASRTSLWHFGVLIQQKAFITEICSNHDQKCRVRLFSCSIRHQSLRMWRDYPWRKPANT